MALVRSRLGLGTKYASLRNNLVKWCAPLPPPRIILAKGTLWCFGFLERRIRRNGGYTPRYISTYEQHGIKTRLSMVMVHCIPNRRVLVLYRHVVVSTMILTCHGACRVYGLYISLYSLYQRPGVTSSHTSASIMYPSLYCSMVISLKSIITQRYGGRCREKVHPEMEVPNH